MDNIALADLFKGKDAYTPHQKSRKAKFFRDYKAEYDPAYFDPDESGKQRLLEQRDQTPLQLLPP